MISLSRLTSLIIYQSFLSTLIINFNMKISLIIHVIYWKWCGPFENLGIGILASASASALQKIYFVLRSLYFYLMKFYTKKTSMMKYFSRKIADLSGSFHRCLEQLFCRNPLAPASEERNTTVNVISGVSRTRKT